MLKKVGFIVLAGVIMASSLAGCGQPGSTGAGGETASGTGTISSEVQTAGRTEEKAPQDSSSAETEGLQAATASGEGQIGTTVKETGKGESGSAQKKKGFPLEVKDMLGTTVKLDKKPEKIAVISGSLLELFQQEGGKSVCTVEPEDGSTAPGSEKPSVGKASNPDLVAILELEPDLVFAETELQNEVISLLRRSEVKVVAVRLDGKNGREQAVKLMKEAAGLE